jgi:hypothetical protein
MKQSSFKFKIMYFSIFVQAIEYRLQVSHKKFGADVDKWAEHWEEKGNSRNDPLNYRCCRQHFPYYA